MNKTFLVVNQSWRLLWVDTQGPIEDGHMPTIMGYKPIRNKHRLYDMRFWSVYCIKCMIEGGTNLVLMHLMVGLGP